MCTKNFERTNRLHLYALHQDKQSHRTPNNDNDAITTRINKATFMLIDESF